MNFTVLIRLFDRFSKAGERVTRRGLFRGAALGAALALVPTLPARQAEAEEQPLMRGALESLRSARSQLQNATADKGGHRVKALQYIDNAIAEVQAGMRFDNRH
jgi:hypothetical protein